MTNKKINNRKINNKKKYYYIIMHNMLDLYFYNYQMMIY